MKRPADRTLDRLFWALVIVALVAWVAWAAATAASV